jgi:hypothetical protein
MSGDPLYPSFEVLQQRIATVRRERSMALAQIGAAALRSGSQFLRRRSGEFLDGIRATFGAYAHRAQRKMAG